VPGRDLAELSRPPGSTRVGYRQEQLEGFARTRLEYVTDASADEIRTFYRESFASGGWVVADLGFSPEEWYFFVIKDEREALVEIHALQEPVVVEIELTDPYQTPASNAPIPQPVDPARRLRWEMTAMTMTLMRTTLMATTPTRARTTEPLRGGRSGSRRPGRWR
jgi:hypothetical protein